MDDAQVGWIAAIIIGGLAGWLASSVMKSDTGIFLNIILGIVGAAIARLLLGIFGVAFVGWVGYLVAGFVGAVILIWLARAVRGRS
ncbi:GlsB/YeaQ/YmgE family stress response membrane protein [Halodurantibacterium flavum]|uniref:GlsB/YeaQ/YmgE family stress response membrane protein n=1 Tax=Halodurantibacterium flavum TaxID=1382802 RepID=A0ABW4SCS7_9RHOB